MYPLVFVVWTEIFIMFKRIKKLDAKIEKGRKKGVLEEDLGPPEMALDDDSSSSTSESGSDSDSEGEGESSEVGQGRHSEEPSASGEEPEQSESGENASTAEYEMLPSVEEAIANPIYVKLGAPLKHEFQFRSCYVCSQAVLKSEKAIDTHIAGGSHMRRMRRFQQFCDSLDPEQKKHPRDGGRDAISVAHDADLHQGQVEAKYKEQQEQARKTRNEQARARRTARKERKAREKLEARKSKESEVQHQAENVDRKLQKKPKASVPKRKNAKGAGEKRAK